MRPFPLFLCLLLLTRLAFAGAAFERSADSHALEESDRQGGIRQKTIARDFVFVDEPVDLAGARLLLARHAETTRSAGAREGAESKLEIEAFRGPGYEQRLWKVSDDGDSGEPLWGELLVTARSGCCGARPAYRAFNLTTGAQLLAYSTYAGGIGPFRIEAPGNHPALRRYVGFLDAFAARDFPSEKDEGQWAAVGVLTYASPDGAISRRLVQRRRVGDTPVFPEVHVQAPGKGGISSPDGTLSLWARDGVKDPRKAFDGLRITLTFPDGEVAVPVKADSLEPASCRGGYRVQRLPVTSGR